MTTSRLDPRSDLQTLVLSVTGMTCGSCVRHIQAALAGFDGVHAVQVDLARQEVRVSHEPALVRHEDLARAIADAGYDVSPLPS